jgi:xylulokinase
MIVIGIDCGTQSTKVVAVDLETGEVLATGGKAHGMVGGLPPGAMEQDPAWWVDAAGAGMDTVIGALGSRTEEVAAIGVSGQQHGMVCLDQDGGFVRPAKLWCDTSTTDQCRRITQALGGDDRVVARVGNTMRPGYTAPKILWLKENEPDNWERTRTILLPHDCLNFWLTGVRRMEYGDASGTALMDIASRRWDPEVCAAIDTRLTGKLPAPDSSAHPCGELRGPLCERWGLKRPPLVSAGGGDNMMAAIGTGNTRPGITTASLGTSGTLFAFSEKPVVDPSGEVAGFCDSTDHWLPLVCTMNVTLVTEHVRGLFGWSYAEMEAAVASVPPGAGGLTLLPYFTGERTPDLPSARGVMAGISLENFDAPHLARAAMEGVALGLAHGLGRLRDLGVAVSSIRLTGGGSNSPAWRQICADVFGVPVLRLEGGAGAALGAAIQAAWTALRAAQSPCALNDICDRLVRTESAAPDAPDPSTAPLYRDMLAQAAVLRTVATSGKQPTGKNEKSPHKISCHANASC